MRAAHGMQAPHKQPCIYDYNVSGNTALLKGKSGIQPACLAARGWVPVLRSVSQAILQICPPGVQGFSCGRTWKPAAMSLVQPHSQEAHLAIKVRAVDAKPACSFVHISAGAVDDLFDIADLKGRRGFVQGQIVAKSRSSG